MKAQDKQDLQTKIDELLERAFRLRLQGVEQPRFHRAQAYADGYMSAVLDQGLVSQHELLRLVSQARRRVEGPSTRALEFAAPESPVGFKSWLPLFGKGSRS